MISTTSTTIAAAAQGMANRKITDHGNAATTIISKHAPGTDTITTTLPSTAGTSRSDHLCRNRKRTRTPDTRGPRRWGYHHPRRRADNTQVGEHTENRSDICGDLGVTLRL
ncbi:MAG: hypothetical protein ACR2F6_16340 [Mycobacteriales bacterium]